MILRLLQEIIDLGLGIFGVAVFALLALMGEVGFRIGRRRIRAMGTAEAETGMSAILSAMLALVAFSLALTMSFAENRYEARRQATLSEANTIGTARLRADLAGAPGKPIAELIEEYARTRLSYLSVIGADDAAEALARGHKLQAEIWQRALPVLEGMTPVLAGALVLSLNDMFDASLAERYSVESRVPIQPMLVLLLGTTLAVTALGYRLGLAGRRQLVLFPILLIILSGSMIAIIDFNRPRGGYTKIDPEPLIWTIQGFAPAQR
jgi:hypothetical protein